jgi:hypothetical protein
MSYSATIPLVEGDTLPVLYVYLKDSNQAAPGLILDESDPATWQPINLTGSTVRLKIREVGSTTIKSTLTGTVTDAINGRVAFQWTSESLNAAGVYEAEIEMETSGGGVQTVYDLIKLRVRSDF